jgi:hypothetical protein
MLLCPERTVVVQAGPFATFFGKEGCFIHAKIHSSLEHCPALFILSEGTYARKSPGDADCNHQ